MFTAYNSETAPENTKATLIDVEKKYGFVPNLYAYLAESETALNAYLHINDQLMTKSSLTPAQVQLALLAISAENGCEFCVAAHSWVTELVEANPESVAAVREGRKVENSKDAALVELAQAIVQERGYVGESLIQRFFDAGYSKENFFDLLVCNMLKSLSNYANHVTKTEANGPLEKYLR